VVTDIYAAGEAPIPGVTVDGLVDAVAAAATCPVHLVRDIADLPSRVAALARPGDLIVTMGAGSIGGVGDRILDVIRTSRHGEAGA
jgi:UDP-N-acetylmuramate--alanine ligase